MPDVLRVIARLNLGGPARHVIRIAQPLERAGWHQVLATGQVGLGEQDLVDEARAAGLDVRIVPGLGRAPRPCDDVRALLELRRLVRRLRPAIVHTHTAKAGTLGRLAAASVRPRPALVHTFHGHVLSHYFGPLASRAARAAERALAATTDAFVAVSERVRDELQRVHRVGRRARWAVIPPGIDVERTAPDRAAGAALRAELGLGPDDVLAGWVGRLEPVKDLDLALAAHERVRAIRPTSHLLVVGDGSQGPAFRERLPALDGVRWLPPRARLGAVYGALDLLVLSSRAEGLPQTVAEARAACVPVLATDVGGVGELVGPGRGGLLVPSGDAGALARGWCRLVDDGSLRRGLADEASRVDGSRFAAEAVAGELAGLYAALVARRLPRAPAHVAASPG